MEIIYCADGNQRFAQIAIECGFLYGARLPTKSTVYFPIYFADQDWKNPDRGRYVAEIRMYRPTVATVLDIERDEQLEEAIGWAEDISSVVDYIVMVPKVFGIIRVIPEKIGTASVRLGYSVPTKYGGTEIPLWEFSDRPIHLLGGNPGIQHDLSNYLHVVSVDGNMAMKAALRWGNRWDGKKWVKSESVGRDFAYESFRESCLAIIDMWGEK